MDHEMLKLKCDIDRYIKDFNLNSAFKLLFVVDFWPVWYFRIREYLRYKSGVVASTLLKATIVLKPLIDGLSGCRIESGAKIGKGLLLHYSIGIVITSQAVIGDNCTLFSQACVIHKANKKGQGAPRIGNNVKLGSGCKIVGNVAIGDHSIVGASAVVLSDVPANSIAVGIPARHFENIAGTDEYLGIISK